MCVCVCVCVCEQIGCFFVTDFHQILHAAGNLVGSTPSVSNTNGPIFANSDIGSYSIVMAAFFPQIVTKIRTQLK